MGIVVGALIFIAIVGVAVWGVFSSLKKRKKSALTAGVCVVVLMILFAFLPFGFVQIESGQLAVVKVWGNAVEVRTEGLHFRNVLSTKYEIYDLKSQEVNANLSAYSKDAQSMTSELTVQFRIQADKAIEIARTYGNLTVLTERIQSISMERTKVVLASESAMDLIANRETLSTRVEASIKASIAQYFVDVTMVALTDITFSDAFEDTVEQKMIAEQEQLRAEYEKQKAITEAERDLEVAKLNAEAEIAKAKGQADSLIEIAKGEAQALKLKTIEVARMMGFLVTVSLDQEGNVDFYTIDMTGRTPDEVELIQAYLKYIAYLEAWDGQLPSVVIDDGTSVIIPAP